MGTDSNSFFDGSGGSMFQGVKDFFTGKPVSIIPDPIQEVINWFGEFVTLIKGLPHNIAKGSAELLSWVYELVADITLKTPLLLFDNDWFEHMLHLFSGISVGAAGVLAVVEGIKRMLPSSNNKKSRSMDFKQIATRWALVAGVSSVFPVLFKLFFRGLNFISDKLIQMNVGIMKVSSLTSTFSTVDTLVLVAFDAMLLFTVIPLLMVNGRRFFDLLVLGVVSPIALVCWVFDSKRHFFTQWFSNIKHLSLVQVYHSFFLLIIGLFIFGVPFPPSFTGTVTKLLVVIGGLYRMQAPPKLISKHLDNGQGIDSAIGGQLKNTKKHILSNFVFSKSVATSPLKWFRKIKK